MKQIALKKNRGDLAEDSKVGYFDASDLVEEKIVALCDLAEGVRLFIGFASPDVDLEAVAEVVQRCIPPDAVFFMVTTAGELCSSECGDRLYRPDTPGRKKIVLQSFSRRMVGQCQLIPVELPKQEMLDEQDSCTIHGCIELLKKSLLSLQLDFPINAQDTAALSYVNGVLKNEAIVMQAIYESKRYPCVFVGGSVAGNYELVGGNFSFSPTYIYVNGERLRNHLLICLVKMNQGYSFGVFKSQGFEGEIMECTVAEADQSLWYVSKVIDEQQRFMDFIDYLQAQFHCKGAAELEAALQRYSFAIKINGDVFARTIIKIDETLRRVYFQCDIGIGEKLFLLRRMSLADSLRRDWNLFMQGKPRPIAGIVTDCLTRRMVNGASLGAVNIFADVRIGGFSSFGELLGVPMNDTMTGVFFFKTDAPAAFRDQYRDFFPVIYGEFKSYFLLRRIKEMQIASALEDRVVRLFRSFKQGGIRAAGEERLDLDAHFADIFNDCYREEDREKARRELLQTLAGVSLAEGAARGRCISGGDIGIMLHYMEVMLNQFSAQRDDWKKKVRRMEDSIDAYTRDELTGAYTRKAGYELIEGMIAQSHCAAQPVALAFIDLNGLKLANDLSGHEEGDIYLRKTVRLLQERIRSTDIICRYGGDEFLLAFPGGTEAAVRSILISAERELERIQHAEKKRYPMSFAFGVMVYDAGSTLAFEEILRILDAKMYRHKLEFKSRRKDRRGC